MHFPAPIETIPLLVLAAFLVYQAGYTISSKKPFLHRGPPHLLFRLAVVGAARRVFDSPHLEIDFDLANEVAEAGAKAHGPLGFALDTQRYLLIGVTVSTGLLSVGSCLFNT